MSFPWPTASFAPIYNYLFYPNQISNCALWLDGAVIKSVNYDSTNNFIYSWNDNSSNLYSAQIINSYYPYYSLVSGYPYYLTTINYNYYVTLAASGSHSGITTPTTPPYFIIQNTFNFGTNDFSIFVAMNTQDLSVISGGTNGAYYPIITRNYSYSGSTIPDVTTGNWQMGIMNKNIYFTYTTSNGDKVNVQSTTSNILPNTWYVFSYTSKRSSISTVYYNGVSDMNAPSSTGNLQETNGNTSILIGAENSFTYFGGTRLNGYITGSASIGEILIYNGPISDAERQQVEGYLAWKWGVNSNLPTTHPYYSNSQHTNLSYGPGNLYDLNNNKLSNIGGNLGTFIPNTDVFNDNTMAIHALCLNIDMSVPNTITGIYTSNWCNYTGKPTFVVTGVQDTTSCNNDTKYKGTNVGPDSHMSCIQNFNGMYPALSNYNTYTNLATGSCILGTYDLYHYNHYYMVAQWSKPSTTTYIIRDYTGITSAGTLSVGLLNNIMTVGISSCNPYVGILCNFTVCNYFFNTPILVEFAYWNSSTQWLTSVNITNSNNSQLVTFTNSNQYTNANLSNGVWIGMPSNSCLAEFAAYIVTPDLTGDNNFNRSTYYLNKWNISPPPTSDTNNNSNAGNWTFGDPIWEGFPPSVFKGSSNLPVFPSVLNTANSFDPNVIPKLINWFDAADLNTFGYDPTTNMISYWINKSLSSSYGANNALFIPPFGPQLTIPPVNNLSQMNYNNMLSFTDSNSELIINYLPIPTPASSIFIVFRGGINNSYPSNFVFGGATPVVGIFGYNQKCNTPCVFVNTTPSNYTINLGQSTSSNTIKNIIIQDSSSSTEFTKNTMVSLVNSFFPNNNVLKLSGVSQSLDVSVGAPNYDTTSNYSYTIGCANTTNPNCGQPWELGEYIQYTRELTVNEQQRVEGYLAWKWGFTLPTTHPNYSMPP